MSETIVISCSILLQFSATIVAFRLMFHTGKRTAWSLITIAMLLMLIRRIIPLYQILSGTPSFQPDLTDEFIGLTLSLLLLIGIIIMSPYLSYVKNSERAVKDAEEKYRSLFNNALDAIYLIEHQTKNILDCNIKATEMTGYDNDELKEISFFDLFLNNEKGIIETKLNEINNTGSLQYISDMHHKRKDGRLVPIEMNASVIEIKGEKFVLCVSRDITKCKQDEEKVRLFYQATDSSVEAICFYNLSKRIIYINNSFEKMFGYRKEEIVGKKIDLIYPEITNNKLQKAIQNTFDGGWVSELIGKRKDESYFPVSVSSSRILDNDGNIIARMNSNRDITETKRAEAKMISYTEQLRSLSDHLETVREEERLKLAREIHDGFGSSLTGLKMDLMVLKKNITKNFDLKLDSVVFDNIQSMSDLIDSTIVMVRKLATELRPGILDELGLVEAMKWYIAEFEKRTEIKSRFTVFPKNIKTDARLATTLFRIFQEILTNIMRHSKATEITVFLRKQKNLVSLLIHDNGVGIKKEEITNKNSLGILGMQERAMIFGGKLEIEGVEGKGTIIKVEIPLIQDINITTR